MNAPSRRGKSKEMFWRKTLARFTDSGLSQVEFSKREGLNAGNLSWWKREIALRDAAGRKKEQALEQKHSDEPRETYWRRILSRFGSSGMSKDEYCAKEGIKPAAFTYWRAELGRRDSREHPGAALPLVTDKMFVPLKVKQPEQIQPFPKIPHAIAEIDIHQGTVRIFETATTEALVTLLRALKELVD